jgi:hypothetical protein
MNTDQNAPAFALSGGIYWLLLTSEIQLDPTQVTISFIEYTVLTLYGPLYTIPALMPVGPVFPVKPVLPVVPVGPVFPVKPVLPVLPVGPVLPVQPVAPVFVVEPAGPVFPVAPVGPSIPFKFTLYVPLPNVP